MPNFQTAKQIAEKALQRIGAFPPSRAQADAAELRRALQWMEMILNTQSGIQTITSFNRAYEIPLEATIGDYLLADYDDEAGTQHVFSAVLVDASENVEPLELIWENQSLEENITEIGRPLRAVVTRAVHPEIKVYPVPTQIEVDAGYRIRVRVQTFHAGIDETGVADSDISLRASWYLWLIKKLSFEIGSGPVRRLPKDELNDLWSEYMVLENSLTARDGLYNSSRPPVTEPMEGC